MVMQRWDTVGDIVTLRDAMDRLFEQSVVRPSRAPSSSPVAGVALMPVDVMEKDAEYVIKAYVPGVKAESVEIGTERETVSIKAHIPGDAECDETKACRWLAGELGYGDVARTLTLPAPIDAGKIEAHVENGVLTVIVPKAEEARPRKIVVKAK